MCVVRLCSGLALVFGHRVFNKLDDCQLMNIVRACLCASMCKPRKNSIRPLLDLSFVLCVDYVCGVLVCRSHYMDECHMKLCSQSAQALPIGITRKIDVCIAAIDANH